MIWVHIRAAEEIVKCRFQIAYRALLPKTVLELASFRRIDRDFALVEIHRKRDIPIRCQLLGLFLNPFVQTPPFMNDDYGSIDALDLRGKARNPVTFSIALANVTICVLGLLAWSAAEDDTLWALTWSPRFRIPRYRTRVYFEPVCCIWPMHLGEPDGWYLNTRTLA